MKKHLISYLFWRRFIQICVLVFLVVVPVLNIYRIHVFHGNLLAFNLAGVPFADPLAALQVFVAGSGHSQTMLLGAGLVLLLALVMGTVFCSWICPFGLLSELAHKKGGVTQSRIFPFWIKTGFLVLGLVVGLLFSLGPILNQFSMPGWISRALQHALLYREFLFGVFLAAAVLAVELLMRRRFWCRYVCPQSVLLSLFSVILPQTLQVRYSRKKCICKASDRPCMAACSLNLNPRKPVLSQRVECTNCGDCVDACRERGRALSLGLGRGK